MKILSLNVSYILTFFCSERMKWYNATSQEVSHYLYPRVAKGFATHDASCGKFTAQCTLPPYPIYQTLLLDFSRVWFRDYT